VGHFTIAGAFVLLALTGCSVDPVQLDGRACPCVAGWVCDSTNRCVPADGGGADATPDAADASDAADAADAFDAGTLIFDEEFDGGTLDMNKWVAAGDGTWTIQGGYGAQTNGNANEAILYAKNFTSATDYHVVARMHSTGPFNSGNDIAPEIAFRTNPGTTIYGIPETYHCNADFYYSQLILQATEPPSGFDLATVNITLPKNFNEGTWFVLDLTVQGSNATCTLTIDGLGLVGTATTTSLTRLAGSFGLKTYQTATEYQYFRVYSVP
jgi:hypothetical protein